LAKGIHFELSSQKTWQKQRWDLSLVHGPGEVGYDTCPRTLETDGDPEVLMPFVSDKSLDIKLWSIRLHLATKTA